MIFKDSKINKSKINDVVLVGGSSMIPKIQQLVREYFDGKQLIIIKNKSELIAEGAAIKAAVMCNFGKGTPLEELVLLNVTQFSLGIETAGGEMTVIIPRNSPLSIKKSLLFSNYKKNQKDFIIKIFEGERLLAKDNILLGVLILDDIKPMARTRIEVKIDVDSFKIINVTATEKSTGKSKKIVITNDIYRLKRDDIYKFIKENEKREEEYIKIKKLEVI